MDAVTLGLALDERARHTPDRVALKFEGRERTFRELCDAAASYAAYLVDRGVGPGDRVVLVVPNGIGFFAAFYGAQHLGAVAVPLFHLSRKARIIAIAAHTRAAAVILGRAMPTKVHAKLCAELESLDSQVLLLEDGLAFEGAAPPIASDSSALAMLQYTSGSTGAPKGVCLTHANLLANVRQMITAARFTEADVFVSWLPVYHDMGLILMTMCPLFVGARLVLLPIALNADRWLGTIASEGGTMTAAPDFAYRFCVKFTAKVSNHDLSTLRFALIAAEPIRAKTIAAFEEKYGLHGVLKPGYGLAEVSVAAAFSSLDEPEVQIDDNGAVASGYPLEGTEIVAEVDGVAAPPGVDGELLVRGPSTSAGYFEDPAATAALIAHDGFIRTGDIGHLDSDGRVYVTGRKKNIIISAGRNLAPAELEGIAEQLESVVACAAIGLDRGGVEGEQIELFVEVAGDPDADLGPSIVRAVHDAIGVRPRKVHFVTSLPRTHNGKIRYPALRQRAQAELQP